MQRFFNAHCHLELGHLRGAIAPGRPFVEWLAQVVALKRSRPHEEVASAVAAGLNQLAATETMAVLDVDSLGVAPELIRAYPMAAGVFTELIQFDAARGEALVAEAIRHQEALPLAPSQVYGLSPHAPYTTTEALLRAARREAGRRGQWLCIHAAETPEETELMLHGRGALCDFLHAAGALPPDWKAPAMRPVPWLAHCGVLGPRTLLVHLNDIDEEDIRLLRETQTRAVLCPGTHVYFGRGAFPLKRLLDAGIAVYLGTDSLASNESLDMRREVRLARELAPDVDARAIEALADWKRARDFGLRP